MEQTKEVIYQMNQRRYEVFKTGKFDHRGDKLKGWAFPVSFKPLSDKQIIEYLNRSGKYNPPIDKIAISSRED